MSSAAASPAIDLSLVIACYHDGSILPASVARIAALLDASRLSYELIFVDDGSRDATAEVVAGLVEGDGGVHRMRFIRHEVNQGRGAAVRDGFLAAGGAIVGYLDIDLEIDAHYILPAVLAIQDGADGVIARRVFTWSWRATDRYLMSKGYAWLVRHTLPLDGISDSEAGFKFFRRAAILPVLAECRDPGWFWDTEITVRALARGLRLRELPCLYQRRRDKQSSVRPLRDTIEYVVRLVRFAQRSRDVDAARSAIYWKRDATRFARAAAGTRWLQLPVQWFVDHRSGRLRDAIGVPAGSRVVELGCGAGELTARMAAAGLTVTAVDLSRPLLELARGRLNGSSGGRVALVEGDVTALPLASACADCVVAIGLMDYLPAPAAFVAELQRVLRPGGQIVVTVPKSPSPFAPLRRGAGAALRARLFDLPPILTALTRADLERLLGEHGFAIQSLSTLAQASWLVSAHKLHAH